MVLNGEPATIVGVLPAAFQLAGFRGDFWRPALLTPDARTNFRGRSLMALARLRPGVSPQAAQQELAAIFAGLVREHPDFNTGWTLNVVPLREQLTSETRPALWVLFGAVVAVLLVACANVAALLLVRATGRRHEMAVKVSLGARPVHLARQLFLETALLVGAGGLLGVAWPSVLTRVVSATARDAGVAVSPTARSAPRRWPSHSRRRRSTAVACGLGPAAARPQGVGERRRYAKADAAASAAASVCAAGWWPAKWPRRCCSCRARRCSPAATWPCRTSTPASIPRSVLTARVSRMGRDAQASQVAFGADVLTRLRALPGVTAAAATSFLPLDGAPGIGSSFLLADRPEPAAGERPVADYRPVTPGYFSTLQIPLRTGRDFTEADIADRPRVAIVNEAFVRQLSADVSPLGRRLTDSLGESQEIVGVVGDVALASLDGVPRPAIYLPFAQLPVGALTFVVRTAGDPASLGRAVEAAVRDVDPNQPVSDVRPLTAVVSRSLLRPRVASAALGIFAAAALLLAAVGVYGVVAYGVSQRRAEFGVRLALGAQPRDVVRLVLRQSLVMVVGGVAAGALLAVPLSASLRSLLFGVGPGDPTTLMAVAALLVGAGALASYLPARSGTRVDPVTALRGE